MKDHTLYCGDALTLLKTLPSESVNCVVTSPPYWGLRDYSTGTWEGGDKNCDHIAKSSATKVFGNPEFNQNRPSRSETKIPGYYEQICPKCHAKRIDFQIGLEATPEEYIRKITEVFEEVRRILKQDGTLWLNLGDTYFGSACGTHDYRTPARQSISRLALYDGARPQNNRKHRVLKPKDLAGIPWRAALALQESGWYLRSDIIWHKPNPMPESIKDRPTKAHEYLFLLTKSERYYYDMDAIREPHTWTENRPSGMARHGEEYRNKVRRAPAGWDTSKGSHNRLIGNYSSERKKFNSQQGGGGHGFSGHHGTLKADGTSLNHPLGRNKRTVWTVATQPFKGAHFATFPEKLIQPCILAGCPPCGVVLDPFCGAGTTGVVALKNHRTFIGIELKPEYIEMSKQRLDSLQDQQTIFEGIRS